MAGAGQSMGTNAEMDKGSYGDMDKKKKEDEMDKSEPQISDEELVKSLDALRTITKSQPADRKTELLSKAQAGSLSDEENAELIKALGGGESEPSEIQDLSKSLDKEENEKLNKSLEMDVTGFLSELVEGVQNYCAGLGSQIEKSQNAQHELSMVLCKGVADIGQVVLAQRAQIASLEKSLNDWGRQPAAPRQSAQIQTQIVEKSFRGQAPAGEQLSKSMILATLEDMQAATFEKGYGQSGGVANCGEHLDVATAKYEAPGAEISPALLQEVIAYRKSNA